jgi:outer membrane receptor protein involved in Fe transport
MSIESEERKALTSADVQGIKQLELGYKIRTTVADLTITPFYSLLDNVLQVSTALDEKSQLYNLQPFFNSIETKGVEVEGTINFSKNFNLRAVATFQSGVFKQFKFASEGPTTSKADDFTVDFSGNNVDTTPTYSKDNFYTFLSWQYMGSRWANAPNTFELPAYSQLDLGAGYNINKHLSLSLNVNNLANTYGAMTWGAPGGFPTTYALAGFTPAVREKQKNAVFPLGTTQPRSFFITATYKF